MLRLAEDVRFVEGVAGEPDYEEPVLRKAHHILTSKHLGEYEHAARLDKLIAQVSTCLHALFELLASKGFFASRMQGFLHMCVLSFVFLHAEL